VTGQSVASATPALCDGALETSGSERLLTAQEVAEKLQKTPRWCLSEARAGRLPHVRLGRSVRFRESSIDALVRQIEQGPLPGSEPGGSPHG
jgi:excisionase family DNA binding protein